MSSTTSRTLVYDGDCSMCRRLSALAERRWLVGSARRLPHDAFEGEEAERLEAAGIRNELAVIDESSGEIRSGYDGILWLLEGGLLRWLVPLLRFPPVRWLLRHDYRLVAYNRRILAPPRRNAACACDPDLHRGYRWAFIVAALLWTGIFGAIAGLGLWTDQELYGQRPVPLGGVHGTAWTGVFLLVGWAATALLALRLPAPRGLDYLGHMAWTYAAMVLPLILAVFLVLLGFLLAVAGLLPFDATPFFSNPSVPARIAVVAWGLALPIAIGSCLWRLPRVGLAKHTALIVALVSWLLPTALLLGLLPTPIHVA